MINEAKHMMNLDPKGVEAARKATALQFPGTWLEEMCLTFTRSYLSTITPAEAGGLVERLRERAESYRMGDTSSEHTATLLDEAATALTTERAAHAKTKRDRDEALKALEPFAEISEWDVGDSESDSDLYRPMDGRLSVAGNIRVGHLRAARRVREGGEANG